MAPLVGEEKQASLTRSLPPHRRQVPAWSSRRSRHGTTRLNWKTCGSVSTRCSTTRCTRTQERKKKGTGTGNGAKVRQLLRVNRHQANLKMTLPVYLQCLLKCNSAHFQEFWGWHLMKYYTLWTLSSSKSVSPVMAKLALHIPPYAYRNIVVFIIKTAWFQTSCFMQKNTSMAHSSIDTLHEVPVGAGGISVYFILANFDRVNASKEHSRAYSFDRHDI